MTVLVDLSMMSLPCVVDVSSGPVNVVSVCLELYEVSKLSSGDVRTSILKE
jgi:hypothetical protein